MEKFKRRLKYILAGEFNERFKKQGKVIRIKYYLFAKKQKNIFIQLYELCLLAVHWQQIPYPYFQHAMFLKSCNLSIKEMKLYIPTKEIKKIHTADYAIISQDKALFSDLMSYYDLPQAQVIFKYKNGIFLDTKNKIISINVVNDLLEQQQCKNIFVKDTLGECGRGIFVYKRNREKEFYNNQDKLSAQHIINVYKNKNIIIQKGLVQNSNLAKINADSINTIRIITSNINGKVTLLAAAIRFGRPGSFVDNAHRGGVSVKVDIPTGILQGPAKKYYDINNYYEHPDSKIKFEGIQIDRWEEAKTIVVRAAMAFHEIKYIGWDVAITDQCVVILEINSDFCIHFQQLTAGGLAEKFQR